MFLINIVYSCTEGLWPVAEILQLCLPVEVFRFPYLFLQEECNSFFFWLAFCNFSEGEGTGGVDKITPLTQLALGSLQA